MKKLFTTILLSFTVLFLNAQAQDKGAFSFGLTYDIGAHGVTYESIYNGTMVDQDTSFAGTQMFHLSAHYNIFKWMSAGLDYRGGKYVEDPDNATANGNKVSIAGLSLRFYPVNKDKFVWYAGPTFGFSSLEINRIYTFLVAIPAKYKFKSSHLGLETGFNWYFTKNVGLNFALGYSGQNYLMTEYYFNGDKQDLSNYENTLKTRGMHVNLGLALTF